jgi:nitrous oxidase accessory protein NosD
MKQHPVSILSDYVVHTPILIEDSTNKSEFESLGFLGNGMMENPFVIEGLSIDGNGASPCIEIRNPQASAGLTSCYFVIRDCYLYNGTDGIYMTDATVGLIEYNMIVDSADGWGIEIIQGNTVGLVYNITVRNNDLSNNYNDNVLVFWGMSRNITIMNNIGNGRVLLETQLNTSIFNNTFSEIYVGYNPYRSELSIINNTVEFIEIDKFADILTHDSFVIVANNTITDGLTIKDSENCEVYDNNFISSTLWLLRLSNADNNTFTNNVFYEIDERYSLFDIDSASEDNSFDYNFYSDYEGVDENDDNIGDTPYLVDVEFVDQHPLMSLRGFEVVPPTISTTTTTTATTTDTISTTTGTTGTTTGNQFPVIMVFSLVGGACGIVAIIVVIIYIRNQN